MNERSPVSAYRLLSRPSTKLKLKDNHYQTPCRYEFFWKLDIKMYISNDKKDPCLSL